MSKLYVVRCVNFIDGWVYSGNGKIVVNVVEATVFRNRGIALERAEELNEVRLAGGVMFKVVSLKDAIKQVKMNLSKLTDEQLINLAKLNFERVNECMKKLGLGGWNWVEFKEKYPGVYSVRKRIHAEMYKRGKK